MIVVFAIDALEYELVKNFKCENLKQKFFGKTDISEFSQPRTMVLWSSFMTGENKEKEVLADGKEMWDKRWDIKETFFSKFDKPLIIDLPGYSYDSKVHGKSRMLLKEFFEEEDDIKKEKVRMKYNKDAFEHHKKIKKEFLKAINSGCHDFVLGYFSLADVVGHLNFGNATMMKMIYGELDEIAKQVEEKCDKLLVLSDHGMLAVGQFGDHSTYGFWSTNFKVNFKNPKITEIHKCLIH